MGMDLHDLKKIIDEICMEIGPGELCCCQIDENGLVRPIEGFTILEKLSTSCIFYTEDKKDYETFIAEKDFLVFI